MEIYHLYGKDRQGDGWSGQQGRALTINVIGGYYTYCIRRKQGAYYKIAVSEESTITKRIMRYGNSSYIVTSLPDLVRPKSLSYSV